MYVTTALNQNKPTQWHRWAHTNTNMKNNNDIANDISNGSTRT